MSNLGKWDRWYVGLQRDDPQFYGDVHTYELGAEWLKDCSTVEDWGCGKGGFKPFLHSACRAWYWGIDGSQTPFADLVADLTEYTSNIEGIFMRHVIEHEREWRKLLDNALQSFTKRMVLVLFTPMQDETHEIAWNEDPGVPDIGFAVTDFIAMFEQHNIVWERQQYMTVTQYGEETVFLLEK